MEEKAQPIEGSTLERTLVECRCGAVQVELVGEALVDLYCHCDDCQAVHGAAYVPESVYRADAVRVTRGDPLAWALKRNPRVTCRECGTRLFIDVKPLSLRGVNGCLLPPGRFRPAFHMHCRFAVAPVKDKLPHYAGRPARFGGSDDTVDW
jgi:hypothetical protein